MRRWSITRRLGALLALLLGGLWLLAVGAAALNLRHELDEVFDGALQETAERLLPLARAHLALGDAAQPIPPLGGAEEEYLFYQLLDGAGRLLLRSHAAPDQPFVAPPRAGFATSGDYRVFTLIAADGLTLQVADPLDHRAEALGEGLFWLLLPLVALPPLAGLALWWTLRRATRPILALQAELHARHGGHLAPLPDAGLPEELAPLARDVNLLLARLERALDGERAFAANSAHELRTPIAAALAQAQLLERSLAAGPEAARAGGLVATLRRLARLVEKLLQLARAESGAALAREPFEARAVLALLVAEQALRPEAAGRLDLVPGEGDCWLDGDLDAWGIAVQNLLDNALLHGEGRVRVRLDDDGTLTVANGGPALPAEELPRLTRRFERGAAPGPGSGLGLAIVAAIARQSGGRLELRSPARGAAEGFEAVLMLPLARRGPPRPGRA